MSISFSHKIINSGITLIHKTRSTPKAYAILLYHRLTENPREAEGINGYLYTDTASFEQQLRYISEIAVPVTLDEIAERIACKREADRLYVALTFDDGYADVIKLGLPILKKYSIPATIFISTLFIDDHSIIPWWDGLLWISDSGLVLSLDIQGLEVSYNLKNPFEKDKFISQAGKLIKYGDSDGEKLLEKIKNIAIGVLSQKKNNFAGWEDIKKAVESGYISIGAHTVSHPVLARKGLNEIYEGKIRLEEMLKREISIFAYPFGERPDISRESRDEVGRAGFRAAVTTFSGYNRAGEDLFLLRRIKCPGGHDIDYFETLLTTGDIKRFFSDAYWYFRKN